MNKSRIDSTFLLTSHRSIEYEGVTVNGKTPADHAGKWETSMFWHMYPELTQMNKFKPEKIKVSTYPNPPHNYYHENPEWKWREDIRKTASPELGEKAVNLIVNHVVSIIKQKLEEIQKA